MKRLGSWLAFGVLLAGLGFPGSARADRHVYEYQVDHPTYGRIGTYVNVVEQEGDRTQVNTELHVAVKILGVTLYRQDATRTELWEKGRLTGFQGVTVTNGSRLEVKGEAQEDGFSITSSDGTVVVPANVRPTNPWTGKMMDATRLMSTRTGHVDPVQITGGGEEDVDVHGHMMRLRHFEIHGPHRQVVWLDRNDIAVFFQAETNGRLVDFILTSES